VLNLYHIHIARFPGWGGRQSQKILADLFLLINVFSRSAISFSRDGTNGPTLKVPVLQIVGSLSGFIHDTVFVNSNLDPAKSDYIKVFLNK
jgi:hypothetical protein